MACRLREDAQIKTFRLVMMNLVLTLLPGCVRSCFITLITNCDGLLVDADNGHLPTSRLENSSFATAKRTTLRVNVMFLCHDSTTAA